MRIVLESEAPEKTKRFYRELKEAFNTASLPLFFTYIGAYPEYLEHITIQIVANVRNPTFQSLNRLLEEECNEMMSSVYQQSPEINNWLQKYKHTPGFYNFQKELSKNYYTNIQLSLIFVALREAVKGWALAAKKLSSDLKTSSYTEQETVEAFIYDKHFDQKENFTGDQAITLRENDLTTHDKYALEKNLLPEYLELCRRDFMQLLKTEQLLYFRVQLEKTLLISIHSFPNLISSPINVVLELTKKYPDFAELLYLLSEHFPTYAVQRLMFSGYMVKNTS